MGKKKKSRNQPLSYEQLIAQNNKSHFWRDLFLRVKNFFNKKDDSESEEKTPKTKKEKILNSLVTTFAFVQVLIIWGFTSSLFEFRTLFVIDLCIISMVIHFLIFKLAPPLIVKNHWFMGYTFILVFLTAVAMKAVPYLLNEDNYSKGIGELVERKDNMLIYKLHKQNNEEVLWKVEDLLGTTDSLRQVKKTVLLTSEPTGVVNWFPTESEMLLYKNIVETNKDSITSEMSSLNYALYNPLKYFDKYGLTLLYNGMVVVESNGYVVSLGYKDVFGNLRVATLPTTETYSLNETVVFKENLNKYINNKMEIVPDIKLNNVKSIGVMFNDTIVPYESFFAEAPQYKKLFSEPYYDNLAGDYVGVANYWSTESYGGRVHYEYPVLFYRDQYGCVYKKEFPNKMERGDFQKYLFGVLIDFSSQQIINKELTTKERMKYKYPVLMFHGQEIGNNSYNYAKIETKRFILNYGLKLAYLAHVDSKQRDVIVDNVNLTFRDMAGNLQKNTCHIPQTYQEYDSLIIYSTDQGYKAAELKFDTEVNFNKIRQGRAYIFRDTIVTESELINDIPDMKQHVEQFLERMKEGK